MKYSILGFDQQKILEYDVDLVDLTLLNYLIYAQSNTNMKHVLDESGYPCVWLQHKHILEDLPILKITDGTLKNRLAKLKKQGLIHSVTVANEHARGTRTYYRITSFLNDLIFENTSFKNDVINGSGHSKMTSNKSASRDSKQLDNNFDKLLKEKDNFQLTTKSSKPNLYSRCVADINSRSYDNDLKTALTDYLQVRLQMKDKPLYANSWKGLLNKLERDFTDDERLQVVYQSIERGYASFFPVIEGRFKRSNSQADKPWEKGVSCRKATKEEEAEQELWLAEQRAKGVKVDF